MARAYLIAPAFALVACRSPTELTVEVTTDVPCNVQSTGIAVGLLGPALDDAPPATTTATCDANGRVGALVVVPRGANDSAIAIKVVGGVDRQADGCDQPDFAGCIVARRALHFVPHEALRVVVPLRASCKAVACSPTTTCVAGKCVEATIADPARCTGAGCGEDALGGEGADGGAPDASSDASSDGAIDAPSSGGACVNGCAGPLALGEFFSCALAPDGTTQCWGQDTSDQLGHGPDNLNPTPRPVRTSTFITVVGAARLAAGVDRTCAFASGGVLCWGVGQGGLLGPDVSANQAYATPIPAFKDAVEIAFGKIHTCWRTDAARLLCMGDNAEGALGTGDKVSASQPVTSKIDGPIAQVSGGAGSTCLVKEDGSAWCFGANGVNQVDPGGPTPTLLPKKLAIGVPVDEIRVSLDFTCARLRSGGILCWGENGWGQSGIDPASGITNVTAFNIVNGPDGRTPIGGAVQLTSGYAHACVRTFDARVMCWGADVYGNLGRGEVIDGGDNRSFFADYVKDASGQPLSDVTFVAAAGDHTCARKKNGEVWCWGRDSDGELAQPDFLPRSTPVKITFQ